MYALKTAIAVFMLMGFVIGFTACAKYPVVSGASTPSAAAPAPTR